MAAELKELREEQAELRADIANLEKSQGPHGEGGAGDFARSLNDGSSNFNTD